MPTPTPPGAAPSRIARWSVAAAGALSRTRPGRLAVGGVRAVRAVVHGYRGEKIALRASALTYITMLSLVPALAVAFAIVRLVGQDGLRRAVHDFIFANLAPGAREQVGASLDEFIARASAGAWGGLGGLFLLASAVTLLHNVERSLNEIWGVTEARPLVQRVLIYWGVLTLGPIALGVSLLASGFVRRTVESSGLAPEGLLALVPLAATVLLLTFLYLAAPNARVRLGPALGGALVAGAAWEAAKWAYAVYAAQSFRYSAIYGSLGAVPLFLLWVYLSWLLVLSGARLAYALQHAAAGASALSGGGPREREILCARVALLAVEDYLRGAEPPRPGRIARALRAAPWAVDDAIERLRGEGLLAEAGNGGVVPARPPEQIRLGDVSRAALRGEREEPAPETEADAGARALAALYAQADREGELALARVDLASLSARLAAGASAKDSPEPPGER